MNNFRIVRTGLLSILLAVFFISSSFASDSNKWRLKTNGGANSDGVLVLEFVPEGEEAFTVDISISDGTRENRVANRIEETLKDELSRRDFRVERDDFEDVLIKKTMGSERFEINVVSNTVDGVKIKLRKE